MRPKKRILPTAEWAVIAGATNLKTSTGVHGNNAIPGIAVSQAEWPTLLALLAGRRECPSFVASQLAVGVEALDLHRCYDGPLVLFRHRSEERRVGKECRN